MASLGHVAVGMAVARLRGSAARPAALVRSMVGWSALSLLPDLDVIGFRFHVPYGAPWGHRGATHSLLFAVVVGAIVGACVAPKARRLRTALFAIVVLASHGLLDTLTDGGRGCALLYPFDLTRYFAPFRPIPVAPIGARFFSPRGLHVALIETLMFSPLWMYAVWPRRR